MSHSDPDDISQILDDIDDQSVAVSRQARIERFIHNSFVVPLQIIWGDWRTRVGVLLLIGFVLMGTVGVMIVPETHFNQAQPYIPPFTNIQYPLGTDGYGQPIGPQIVHATPAMLKMILAGAVVSIGLATVIGVIAGYKMGTVDTVLMYFTDIVLTIPSLPLILVIAAVWVPKDPFLVGMLLAIDNWPGLARTLRSQVLSIRHESYVESSRAIGLSSWRIFRKDLVTQLMPYITISAAGAATGVVFEAVGLYFLGILPFTTANWGVMMNEAYHTPGVLANLGRIHWIIWPMLAIFLMTLALTMLSQGMDRLFNPRIRARHADSDEHTDIIQDD